MGADTAVWKTLAHIYLSVLICGVVVPVVTALGALVGFSESIFAMLGFGAAGLAVCCGLVFLTNGRFSAADHPVDVPPAASADPASDSG